jgi:hypothetical protein
MAWRLRLSRGAACVFGAGRSGYSASPLIWDSAREPCSACASRHFLLAACSGSPASLLARVRQGRGQPRNAAWRALHRRRRGVLRRRPDGQSQPHARIAVRPASQFGMLYGAAVCLCGARAGQSISPAVASWWLSLLYLRQDRYRRTLLPVAEERIGPDPTGAIGVQRHYAR